MSKKNTPVPDAEQPVPIASEKRRHGPLPKLTPEIQAAICEAIRIAVPFGHACEANGVRADTGHYWMKLGNEGKMPYFPFFEAVTRARAESVQRLVLVSQGDGPSGARWILERRFHQDFGPKTRVEYSGPSGGAINVRDVSQMSDEELRKLASAGDDES